MTPESSTNPPRNGDGRDRGKDPAERIRQAGKEALSEARGKVRSGLEAGKQSATAVADDATEALEDVGNRFAEQGHETLAQATHAAADRLSRLAHYVETHSLDEFLREARRLARSKPSLMIAGGIALGFVLSRFLKASEPDDGDSGYASYEPLEPTE